MKLARIATVPFLLQSHSREQFRVTIGGGHMVALYSGGGAEVAELIPMPGVCFRGVFSPECYATLAPAAES